MLSLTSAFAQLRMQASAARLSIPSSPSLVFTRHRSQLAPRRMTWIKRQKGTIPIPIGGSTKGTTLAYGEWGIRIRGNGARFSAKQLTTVQELIKRKLKSVKGAKVFLRVFPDIPICIKVCRRSISVPLLLTRSWLRVMRRVWGRVREHLSIGRRGSYCVSLPTNPPFNDIHQRTYRSCTFRDRRFTYQRGAGSRQ